MQYSINIPNFGEFADARTVATLARAAEDAGWDALFVWDHVVHDKETRRGHPFGDPWLLLTAAALATTTLRLGTLVTPVPRRRPHQLARQVATLDLLSGGRVVFGAGLGAPVEDEYGSFGEQTDPKVLAEMLDEGLGLLAQYWSGERVDHAGTHFTVRNVELLPATVQQPRPPVWVAGYWPNRKPMRRAARWDGAVPLFLSARHGHPPGPDEVREVAAFLHENGAGAGPHPFEVVVGGATDPASAEDVVGALREVGATWWDERFIQGAATGFDRLAPVLNRVEQGPPRLR